jgi:hypothetical protein
MIMLKKGLLLTLMLVGCYSPTAGWNPRCADIPYSERDARGKPRIICSMPSTPESRARSEAEQRDAQADRVERSLKRIEKNTDD